MKTPLTLFLQYFRDSYITAEPLHRFCPRSNSGKTIDQVAKNILYALLTHSMRVHKAHK